MKIVLDTNVLISGVFWGGNPKRIIGLSVSGDINLYATEDIMREYFRIIEKISKKDEDLINHWKMYLLDVVNIIETNVVIDDCRDPKDNMFLECAVCAEAKYIVSGDEDLLVLNPFRGVDILKPEEFLKTLNR